MIYFKENLAHLRKTKGCTLDEIADITGFSRSQWNNYELGISYPKFLDLIKISEYFNVSESDLIHKNLSNEEVILSRKTLISDFQLSNNDQLLIETQKEFIEVLKEQIEQLKELQRS